MNADARTDIWLDRGRGPALVAIAVTTIAAIYVIVSFHVDTPLVPLFASILPLAGWTRRATANLRMGAGIVMLLFAWLGLASVGALFLPGAIAMVVAMVRT